MQHWLLSWGERHYDVDRFMAEHDEQKYIYWIAHYAKYLLEQRKLNVLCAKVVSDYFKDEKTLMFITKDFIGSLQYNSRKILIKSHIQNPLNEELRTLATFNGKVVVSSSNSTFVATKSLKKCLFEDNSVYYANINCIDITPDEHFLASGGIDGSVIIWSKEFNVIKRLYGHREEIKYVKFAHNIINCSLQLFSVGSDGAIFRWNPLSGEMLGCISYSQGTTVQLFEVAFRFGIIAIAYNNPIIALYRCNDDNNSNSITEGMHDKKILHLQQMRIITLSHQGMPTSVKFTQDAKWIVSAGEDETLHITLLENTNVKLICDKFITTRSCLSFLNTITGFEILAEPPKSSVFIIVACTSDGRIVKWVSNPEDIKRSFTQILQLHFGSLLSIKML